MNYAKLINGKPRYTPNPIVIGDYRISNPTPEMLTGEGYKPVIFTDPPETEPGYRAVESWTETEREIVQGWTVEEVTELDGEEAMQMLFGGDESVE